MVRWVTSSFRNFWTPCGTEFLSTAADFSCLVFEQTLATVQKTSGHGVRFPCLHMVLGRNGLTQRSETLSGTSPPSATAKAVRLMPYRKPDTLTLRRNEFLRLMRSGAPDRTVFDHVTSRHAEYVIDRYRRIPPGGNWEAIANTLTNYTAGERTHSNIYRRLTWDDPSITIGHYRKSMLIHPHQQRGLSLREASRLQSFPDWFQVFRFREWKRRRIGSQTTAIGECRVPARNKGDRRVHPDAVIATKSLMRPLIRLRRFFSALISAVTRPYEAPEPHECSSLHQPNRCDNSVAFGISRRRATLRMRGFRKRGARHCCRTGPPEWSG